MGFEKSFKRFFDFDEMEYECEISQMSEGRLRLEHKILQRGLVAASGVAGTTAVAGFTTAVTAWLLTGIASRRSYVKTRQIGIIEKRLQEEGWDGHDMRFRDFAIGLGPTMVAEMAIPAGGALLGHATIHVADVASQHGATALAQHAAQASSQHAADVASAHAAGHFAASHPVDAVSAVAHNTSTFAAEALQGAQSEIFTATHGLLGHAASQLPVFADLASAQAAIFGEVVGQLATAAGVESVLSHGIEYGTKQMLLQTLDKDKHKALQTRMTKALPVGYDLATARHKTFMYVVDHHLNNPVGVDFFLLWYRQLKHKSYHSELKQSLAEIEKCTAPRCPCMDYNRLSKESGACVCGHGWAGHSNKLSETENAQWITNFVVDLYICALLNVPIDSNGVKQKRFALAVDERNKSLAQGGAAMSTSRWAQLRLSEPMARPQAALAGAVKSKPAVAMPSHGRQAAQRQVDKAPAKPVKLSQSPTTNTDSPQVKTTSVISVQTLSILYILAAGLICSVAGVKAWCLLSLVLSAVACFRCEKDMRVTIWSMLATSCAIAALGSPRILWFVISCLLSYIAKNRYETDTPTRAVTYRGQDISWPELLACLAFSVAMWCGRSFVAPCVGVVLVGVGICTLELNLASMRRQNRFKFESTTFLQLLERNDFVTTAILPMAWYSWGWMRSALVGGIACAAAVHALQSRTAPPAAKLQDLVAAWAGGLSHPVQSAVVVGLSMWATFVFATVYRAFDLPNLSLTGRLFA